MQQFTILSNGSTIQIFANHITVNAAVNKLRLRNKESTILCEFNLSDI